MEGVIQSPQAKNLVAFESPQQTTRFLVPQNDTHVLELRQQLRASRYTDAYVRGDTRFFARAQFARAYNDTRVATRTGSVRKLRDCPEGACIGRRVGNPSSTPVAAGTLGVARRTLGFFPRSRWRLVTPRRGHLGSLDHRSLRA